MLDYFIGVCGDDGVEFSDGLSAEGYFDADVLDHVQMRLQDCRLAKDAINLGGEVEGLAGIEDRKRFGVDYLAGCENRVVEKLDVSRISGFCFLGAAQYAFIAQQSLVDDTANF